MKDVALNPPNDGDGSAFLRIIASSRLSVLCAAAHKMANREDAIMRSCPGFVIVFRCFLGVSEAFAAHYFDCRPRRLSNRLRRQSC